MSRSKTATAAEQTPSGHLAEGPIGSVLGYQLAQASIVTTAHFMRVVGKPYDLRPVELTVLELLQRNAEVTATRLAKALAMTTPGITAWLVRLEARKLLRREPHATDGRAQLVKLTPQGKALADQAVTRLLEADDIALRALSRGERLLLLELLHRVASTRGLPPDEK